jgi:hypothetical protein
LQAADLPGFSPIDASVETFQDPNDQGADQAFIQCAGSTPLLDQFDSGSAATVSQVYGKGTDPFGTPVLSAASAVFTDGSVADAQAAYAALSGSGFARCWASTQDSLNQQEGVTVPSSPSTVGPLTVPPLGAAATGFVINLHYSALGTVVDGSFGVSVVEAGSYVVMLITVGYDTQFPDLLRLAALSRIAGRLGATTRSTTSTTGTTACTAPSPVAPVPLLSDAEVASAVGRTLVYGGWTQTPGAVTGTVDERSCTWHGKRLPPGPVAYDLAVDLTVSAPYSVGAARHQFDDEMGAWQASSFSGIGDAAFWLPLQDATEGLEVLTGNRIVTVAVTAPGLATGTYRPAELQLAGLAISRLGTGGSGASTPPAASVEDAVCHLGVHLGVEPKWLHDLNTTMQKAALKTRASPLPIPIASWDLPAGMAVNVKPAIDPGAFTFCGVGLTAGLLRPPWSQQDTTQLQVPQLQSGGGTSAQFGPFVYSAPDGAWTTVDRSATPLDQPLTTQWKTEPDVVHWDPSAGLTWSTDSLDASVTLAQVTIASVHTEVKLVLEQQSLLTVDLGPTLVLSLQISNKNLVDELGKELAEEGGDPNPETAGQTAEQKAADMLSKQAADDVSAEMQLYEQDMLGATGDITAALDKSIDQQLLAKFSTWFADLEAGTPVVQELVDEGVTADEVPVAAESAIEAELAAEGGGFLDVVGVACDVVFDGACLV